MRLKTLLLTLSVTLISCNLFAQYGGMYGRGMGGMRGGYGSMPGSYIDSGASSQRSKMPELNFIGSVGYFDIDGEKLLEKMKIDEDKNAEKAQAIIAVLDNFKSSRQELIESNRTEIDKLEFAPDNIEVVKDDMNQVREIMKGVNASAKVIKPLMVEKHKVLNDDMAAILTSKELRRWEKFYKSECKDNRFDPDKKHPSAEKPGEHDPEEGGKGPGKRIGGAAGKTGVNIRK